MQNQRKVGWIGRSALGLAVVALCFAAVVTFVVPDADAAGRGNTKVTICHFPPGNPDNVQTITVGEPAVAPHVALHGDTIGPCDAGDGDGGGDDDDDGGDDDGGGDDDDGGDCDGDDCDTDNDG